MMRRSVLLVAHPGHELLVHHWMERERPLVLILTDGSGSAGQSRLKDTRRIVLAAGALPGPVFGEAPDRDFYRAILARDAGVFRRLVRRAAEAMADCRAQTLVSDPMEACEPMHDLAAAVARLAAVRAASALGRSIAHFEFPIETRPSGGSPPPGLTMIGLDKAAARRKLDAIRGVPALGIEFERLVERDPSLVEREWLAPVPPARPLLPQPRGEPFYERQGRERVAQGVFHELITYADHLAPLAANLARSERLSRARHPDPAHAG
jgi:hypothetical protein